MENQNEPIVVRNTQPVQTPPLPPEPTIDTQDLTKNLITIAGFIILGICVGIFMPRFFDKPPIADVPIVPTPVATLAPSVAPTPTIATAVIVKTPTLTETPVQRSFTEEEKLMRKTLAGFEMYVGTSNTSGALSFFTPAVSAAAKQKYDTIRTKILPFTLKSWSFVMNGNDVLATEEIKGGYRVRMTECRSDNPNCSIYFLEMVRNESAENGFSVDRYYSTSYMYQNNLGEEIKYQGFGL
jgi:hypothetical protein